MKKKGIFTGCVTLLTLLLLGSVHAGSLNSPGDPTNAASQSYTLEDIWNRLNDGTDGSQSTFTEPGLSPSSTGYTINDVINKAPAKDDTNGATPADVLSGKTFWGLNSGAGEWGPRIGTASTLTLHKTGQTASYGSADDGALQKGVSIANRFAPNGDGTVTDNVTGLIWLQDANCWGPTNWTTASSNAAALANGQCGLTDGSVAGQWRLPTVNELLSLIHFGYYDPALSNDAGDARWGTGTSSFTNVISERYWSATTYTVNPSDAWFVHLCCADMFNDPKTNTYYVWPVR
jgi:hypothetical protein